MALKPPLSVPDNIRDFSRWCEQQAITADDDTVATATIQDEAVTLAKMADLAAGRIIGRLSTDGTPQALTAAQVVSLLQSEGWAFTGNIGFFGETPIGQQTPPALYIATTVSGTGDDADINTNFTDIQTSIGEIRAVLAAFGLTS